MNFMIFQGQSDYRRNRLLGAEMCKTLAALGAKVAILDINLRKPNCLPARSMRRAALLPHSIVMLSRESIEGVAQEIDSALAPDILINAAGGNKPATTSDALSLICPWMPYAGCLIQSAGTILPSQIWKRDGSAQLWNNFEHLFDECLSPANPHSGIFCCKAVERFHQWLAVHLAQEYSPNPVTRRLVFSSPIRIGSCSLMRRVAN